MTNAPPDSAKAAVLERFRSAEGAAWSAEWDVETKLPRLLAGGTAGPYGGSPEDAARSFLTDYEDLLGVTAEALRHRDTHTAGGVSHVRFEQVVGGLPVSGVLYAVHVRSDGRVDMVNGNIASSLLPGPMGALKGDLTASLPLALARSAAQSSLGGRVTTEESRLVVCLGRRGHTASHGT